MFYFLNKNICSIKTLIFKNMSSESPRKKSRHVCLICGSYTTLMINIYEPRSGPNIVEVINQKFGMQVNKLTIMHNMKLGNICVLITFFFYFT